MSENYEKHQTTEGDQQRLVKSELPDTTDKAIRYTVFKEIKTRLNYVFYPWNRGL